MIAHLGPTNSGKTHDALRFLVENGRGVYAAPLRMLAQEAHRRLAAEIGEDGVGLVTGEERVNPDAPIICCTAEMAPMHGETLVLDEVQWAEDEERGSAWTRLMLGGEYRHILLLGAVEALPLVRNAFPDVEVRFFERKAPLDWIGKRGIAGLGPGTVVVAFSRRAVIGLAGELNQFHPGKVAVLYGAMPLASRREEIDRFISGAAEVCAATDVLGHGVNLPCETLLFAETNKFDGHERRDLEPWEIAQIAGRAGRFGFHERGHVGVLTGVPWAHPDPELVQDALTPHVEIEEGHFGYRIVDTGRLRPQLSDLNVTRVDELEPALHAWRQRALRYWSVDGWLTVESIQPLLARLDAVRGRCSTRGCGSRSPTCGSSCRRRSTRTGSSCSACSRARSRATRRGARCSSGSSIRSGSAMRASPRPSRRRARRRSCAGSRCSTPASPASRSRRRPRSRRRRPRASSGAAGGDRRPDDRPLSRAARRRRRGRRSATAASWRAATAR